jgi:squalene synthase HpnC
MTPTKNHHAENFPVASFVLRAEHRAAILAFYAFARTADNIADSEILPDEEKLRRLEVMRAGLICKSTEGGPAGALKHALAARKLTAGHALDLLEAFRRDVSKKRYANWEELMEYCRYSAAPVGRFVLDVHGESRTLWPQSDALCAALQVINHLQDCGRDYREIDRVYLPADALGSVSVEALGEPSSSEGLRSAIASLARRAKRLLDKSRSLSGSVKDGRLAFEIAFIQKLAESLAARLHQRDPLSERVRHSKWEMGAIGLATLFRLELREEARR